MIGYYIHHQGSGHLHRALAIQRQSELDITGLSSLPRPPDWVGDWRQLADDAVPKASTEYEAGGWLHYVPQGHDGLRRRMGALSAWIARHQPAALVVDVSVEVALLARLHGVPVITLAQPGVRDDRPHSLGYGISDAIIGPWPRAADQMWQVSDPTVQSLLIPVGAISRFAPQTRQRAERLQEKRVVVLNGTGGTSLGALVERAAEASPTGPGPIWIDRPAPGSTTRGRCCARHRWWSAIAARTRSPRSPPPAARRSSSRSRASSASSERWPPVEAAGPAHPRARARLLAGARGLAGAAEPGRALDGSRWSLWNDGGGAQRAATAGRRHRVPDGVSA